MPEFKPEVVAKTVEVPFTIMMGYDEYDVVLDVVFTWDSSANKVESLAHITGGFLRGDTGGVKVTNRALSQDEIEDLNGKMRSDPEFALNLSVRVEDAYKTELQKAPRVESSLSKSAAGAGTDALTQLVNEFNHKVTVFAEDSDAQIQRAVWELKDALNAVSSTSKDKAEQMAIANVIWYVERYKSRENLEELKNELTNMLSDLKSGSTKESSMENKEVKKVEEKKVEASLFGGLTRVGGLVAVDGHLVPEELVKGADFKEEGSELFELPEVSGPADKKQDQSKVDMAKE